MSDQIAAPVHHGTDYGLTFGGSALSILSGIAQFLSHNHNIIASLGVILGTSCAVLGAVLAVKNHFLNKRLVLAKIKALEQTQKIPKFYDETDHY